MRSLAPHALALLCSVVASGMLPGPTGPRPGPLGAVARADETVVMTQCTLKGSLPIPKGTQLFDAHREGRVIGEFTGAVGPLSVTFPADPSTTRGRASTSAGKPSLRLDGWASVSTLPVFTARDVPVHPDHVWIASGHRVKVIKGAITTLTAQLAMAGTGDQLVRGIGACDSFSLDPKKPTAQEIPGNARGYQTKGNAVTLFDGAAGSELMTINMLDGVSQLFWSTEARGAFVHVMGRGDVVVDAWMRLRDLTALKQGEMLDQAVPPTSQVAGARLSLDKAPRLVTAVKDIAVRLRPEDKEKTIGVIESGAEFYEVSTVAKWTNVMPRDLYISPPSDGGFWVPAADVPK